MGFRNSFYSSFKNGKRRGVAVLISNSTRFEFISQISDKDGRFILIKGKIDQKEVTLFNVYAPPGSDKSFFRKVFDLIASETYGTLICAGDFNMLLKPLLDTTNRKRKSNTTAKYINKVLKDLGLNDVWRFVHGSVPGYTFYSARHSVHSRIDYCFMYGGDLHRVRDCRVGPRDLSDHSGIYLTLHLDSKQRKTLWRLNTGMLNDPAFRNSIVSDLNSYLQDNDTGDVNPSILWDAAKAVLRGKIIARTSMLRKIKATKLSKLQEELID